MATSFVIERGVPLPPSALAKYPFSEMGVGDSFTVTKEKEAAVRAAAYSYASRHDIKLAVRAYTDTIRVFRTA